MNWYQCYGLIYLLNAFISSSNCAANGFLFIDISRYFWLCSIGRSSSRQDNQHHYRDDNGRIMVCNFVSTSLNRMYVVTRKGLSADTPLSFIDWIPIQLSWIGGLVYALCYVYEGRNTHFDKNLLSWTGTLQWKPFNLLLLYIKFSLLGAGLIACFVVVISMMLKRRDQSTDRRLFKPLEIQLFAQTSTIFVIAIIYTVMWYVIPQGSENLHILALVNLDQIVINALSPYLNLIMSG
ncbi:hypothetical protein M3Y98_01048700 [Aphelenchoides besseyi]|nr:hypothetical protein M3Y98_01048700 [Aphelenchoides besseyi]